MVAGRHMSRDFRDEPLPKGALGRVVEAAVRGPSAGFVQAVEWLVLEEAADRRRFFEATCDPAFLADPGEMAGLFRAPAVLVPAADAAAYAARYAEADKAASGLAGRPAETWQVPYWLVDAAFGVMLALLAAEDEGLGALFFRLHAEPAALEAAFGIPAGRAYIGAVALGLPGPGGPAGSPARRSRRGVEELVHRGSWNT